MPLIYLFGLDGTGKTTLGRLLYSQFSCSRNTKYAWMRGSHTLAFVLNNLLLRFDVFKDKKNPYYTLRIPGSFRRGWRLIEFMSVLPILIFRFLLPSWSNRLVIADRYIPDFIVWLATTSQWSNYLDSFLVKFLIAIAGKADVKIYLVAKPEVLIERKKELNTSFIEKQFSVYNSIFFKINGHRIDTSSISIDQSFILLYSFCSYLQTAATPLSNFYRGKLNENI